MSSDNDTNDTVNPLDTTVDNTSLFDYCLTNIRKTHESQRLELLDVDIESDISVQSLDDSLDSSDLDQTLDYTLDDNINTFGDLNESQLKIKGEEDINKHLDQQEVDSILESIESNISLKCLNMDQICCLIKSIANTLQQMSCQSNSDSYFESIYKKTGYPGIAATIRMTLFTKSQKFYILGCIYGLFTGRKDFGHKVFGVLFPETMVQIIMKVRHMSYSEALGVIKYDIPSNTFNSTLI